MQKRGGNLAEEGRAQATLEGGVFCVLCLVFSRVEAVLRLERLREDHAIESKLM